MKLFVGAKGFVVYEGKILIVRESSQYEDGTETGRWDLPGGRLEAGERLMDGLVREIKEESGLTVTPGMLIDAGEGFPVIKEQPCHIVRLYYACTTDSDVVTLSSDHDAYEWIEPAAYVDFDIMDNVRDSFERYLERTATH